jgi:hypothetical protein
LKRYLSILNKEENQFGFKDETDEILNSDIEIDQEDYNNFFDLKSIGKQFRVKKTPTGKGLFDYIEEYTLEVIEVPTKPTELERIAALEMALLEVL